MTREPVMSALFRLTALPMSVSLTSSVMMTRREGLSNALATPVSPASRYTQLTVS